MDALLTPVAKRLPRRHLLWGLGALAGLGVTGIAFRPGGHALAGPQVLEGATMGTSYTVKIAGRPLSPARLEAVHADVHAAFTAVDERMSLYRPTSELSRLNAHPAGRLEVSPALFEVLEEAARVAVLSDGAFDPSVAPLVDAWGFGPSGPHGLPSAAALAKGRGTIGHAGLELDTATRTVSKATPQLTFDLGGIAKGKGVDEAARVLAASGIEHFMVEAGGEIVTEGQNAEGTPGRSASRSPMPGRAAPASSCPRAARRSPPRATTGCSSSTPAGATRTPSTPPPARRSPTASPR
jgi:FAD:protein FMN transferase